MTVMLRFNLHLNLINLNIFYILKNIKKIFTKSDFLKTIEVENFTKLGHQFESFFFHVNVHLHFFVFLLFKTVPKDIFGR